MRLEKIISHIRSNSKSLKSFEVPFLMQGVHCKIKVIIQHTKCTHSFSVYAQLIYMVGGKSVRLYSSPRRTRLNLSRVEAASFHLAYCCLLELNKFFFVRTQFDLSQSDIACFKTKQDAMQYALAVKHAHKNRKQAVNITVVNDNKIINHEAPRTSRVRS